LVADLRLTAARYPADQRLKQLTRELAAASPRFAELWESGAPMPHQDFGRHKIIDHPDVGHITLDCDKLIVAADDIRIMIYTAEPTTEDAERLGLAIVLGTQSLIDGAPAPRAPYTGIKPCLRAVRDHTCLSRSRCMDLRISSRVWCGSTTASMKPRSAAVHGIAMLRL